MNRKDFIRNAAAGTVASSTKTGIFDLTEKTDNREALSATATDWFIRNDGSVIQSVHYNAGDNRQKFQLYGGNPNSQTYLFPNHAKPGERVFDHPHQGFSWETNRSRRTVWAPYGFAATQDQQKSQIYRKQTERITHSLIDRCLTPTYQGDTRPPGDLRHRSSTRPSDGMLTYGQYFLFETLLALGSRTPASGRTGAQ